MKNVAILQNNFIPGGTTRVTLAVIEVMNDLDIIPDIYCYKGMNGYGIRQDLNTEVNYQIKHIPDLGIKSFGALKGIIRNIYFRQRSEKYSLVFNADSYLMFLPDERKYLHYILYPRRVEIKYFSQNSSPFEKYLYNIPLSLLYQLEKVQESSSYLVLSSFSKNLLVDYYHIPESARVHVLYPPVDIDSFWSTINSRVDRISSVGSFDPSKNQLQQIELAARLPEFTFFIMGSTILNKAYFRKCQNKVRRLGLSNVELLPDVSLKKLKVNLQESKFFLHSKKNEPFGIAAVEAAAAGCLPIVHQSGGQKETIPYQELQYKNFQEVPDMIRRLNADGYGEMLNGVRKHIKQFDKDRFKKELQKYIRIILEQY